MSLLDKFLRKPEMETLHEGPTVMTRICPVCGEPKLNSKNRGDRMHPKCRAEIAKHREYGGSRSTNFQFGLGDPSVKD